MQCACAILSSVAWPDPQYFPILSHKQQVFGGEKVTEHKMCVLIFLQHSSEIFLILRQIWAIYS